MPEAGLYRGVFDRPSGATECVTLLIDQDQPTAAHIRDTLHKQHDINGVVIIRFYQIPQRRVMPSALTRITAAR
jgi:hypothetical protein